MVNQMILRKYTRNVNIITQQKTAKYPAVSQTHSKWKNRTKMNISFVPDIIKQFKP